MFLAVYSWIEDTLVRLCEEVAQELGLPDRLWKRAKVQPGEDDIDRARLFLSQHTPITIPLEGPAWKAVTDYRRVRNCFAHSSGRLNDCANKDEVRSIVEKHGNLELEHGRTVIIRQGFCEEVVDTASRLFRMISESSIGSQATQMST